MLLLLYSSLGIRVAENFGNVLMSIKDVSVTNGTYANSVSATDLSVAGMNAIASSGHLRCTLWFSEVGDL
jgi:hypothetical protein